MADYTKTEPAFDFQKGLNFIIIKRSSEMTVGRERYKKLGAKKYTIRKRAEYKIYNGTGYGINIEDTFVLERITIVTTSVRKSSAR